MKAFFFTLVFSVLGLLNPLMCVADAVKSGVVHEAYVYHDNGPILLYAVKDKPPEPLQEIQPEKKVEKAIWIPGYWFWDLFSKEYIWISGVYRIPPPGLTWLPGFWHHFESGWVWVPGFWSLVPENEFTYINTIPPDPIPEKPDYPDSSNYFWNPGQWIFDHELKKYIWMRGNWEELDPNWIIVPAHYQWRIKGYIYIPSYWDWTLDRRGKAYSAVDLQEEKRGDLYRPEKELEFTAILENILLNYPDFLYVTHHQFHFHPETFMINIPSWWQWHSWWSLPWYNQWAIWWWYTHSSYPQPPGLTKEIIERIRPAIPRLMNLMRNVVPPFIVTPTGVVPPSILFSLLGDKEGGFVPIVPYDEKKQISIQREAGKYFLNPKKQVIEFSSISLNPVKIPPKPILTQQQPRKTLSGKTKNNESHLQKEKYTIPVKDLKEARSNVSKQGTKATHVAPPNPEIIKQVIPGPRIGPQVDFKNEFKNEQEGKSASPESKNLEKAKAN